MVLAKKTDWSQLEAGVEFRMDTGHRSLWEKPKLLQ